MRIRKSTLTGLGVSPSVVETYLDTLNERLPAHEIETPLRTAHFLAQVLHESSLLKRVEENLHYSAQRLLEVFPRYFTSEQAHAYAGQPQKIGSRVYANRLGNGDEASGDGYRYRGRGLIQLTGKTNYRAFSRWIGDDCVAQPDRVSNLYAVDSAIYYWSENGINEPADRDDVRTVTRIINGGLNGLEHRMQLLERAKILLEISAEPMRLSRVTHLVKATELNLRSAPRVAASTWIGTLGEGAAVRKLGAASRSGWWRVEVVLNGRLVQGVVNSHYLRPAVREVEPIEPPSPASQEFPAAHLQEQRRDITRRQDWGRAYPLGEPGMPRRRGQTAASKSAKLVEIAQYLDSENPDHLRYKPKSRTTFCNIYAYDYCYLAGVYLPRVWWTGSALLRLLDGEDLAEAYGQTVNELNANSLYDWLVDFGQSFGWERVFDLDVLQAGVNNGDVGIIVAQHRDSNRSGHIVAVAPEHNGVRAARDKDDNVLRPVESQAGRNNYRFVTKSRTWWSAARFRRFAFWRHT